MRVCRPRWQKERRRSVSLQATALKDGTDDDEDRIQRETDFTIGFDAANEYVKMRMDKLGTGYQTRELLLQDISKSSFQH